MLLWLWRLVRLRALFAVVRTAARIVRARRTPP
jgi:hypothetical protein